MRSSLIVACLLSAACYQNTPADLAARPPASGDRIALEITDAGRAALAERFGPGVAEIEGALIAASEASYNLSVSKVTYLRTGQSQWAGERVSIERAHVGQVFFRTLSRKRTALTAAAVGGGLLALILTRELVISGRERDPNGEPPGPDQIRIPALSTIR